MYFAKTINKMSNGLYVGEGDGFPPGLSSWTYPESSILHSEFSNLHFSPGRAPRILNPATLSLHPDTCLLNPSPFLLTESFTFPAY